MQISAFLAFLHQLEGWQCWVPRDNDLFELSMDTPLSWTDTAPGPTASQAPLSPLCNSALPWPKRLE